MGFMDEYNALKKKRKEEETANPETSFMDRYNELKQERTEPVNLDNIYYDDNTQPEDMTIAQLRSLYPEIARKKLKRALYEMNPLSSSENRDIPNISEYEQKIYQIARDNGIGKSSDNTTERRTWFDAGPFSDGYDLFDVSKSIIGTLGDIKDDAVEGVVGMVEPALDTILYAGGNAFDKTGSFLLGKKRWDTWWSVNRMMNGMGFVPSNNGESPLQQTISEKIAEDMINEEAVTDVVAFDTSKLFMDTEDYSLLGEKSDSLVQSGGQLAATIGLNALGIPWFATTGVTSFGKELDNAVNQGASLGEAGTSAAITAATEIITEKIFSGFSFGGKTLEDVTLKPLIDKIANKTVRTLFKLGVDVVGEGIEELLAGCGSAIGQKLTYADEKELNELFSKEDRWESFIGGIVLSLGGNGVSLHNSVKNGVDYVSGMTANEEAVVNKETENRIAELEKDGNKLKASLKSKIKELVKSDLEKGYISTDTIEEVLGGETYKTYKDTIDSEDAQIKLLEDQIKELGDAPNTVANSKKFDSLQQQLDELKNNSKRDQLKLQLSDEVFGLVKDSRLAESYNENGRRSQAFEADLTKYDEKQRETIQRAIDSGILNNTNRTHEFVDMVAKVSADKGVLFDFTNNEKLKDSVFAVEGKTVNGYFDKQSGTVGINIDSAKALNTVVGHEITHVLEDTELYDAMKETLFEYAKSKGEYQSRYDSLVELYKDVNDVDIEAELAADLVGDYLFTDADFINHLSTKNRNVFQKIYDELLYLYKIATAGSKEAIQLEKVKKAFEKAYREGGKATADTKYSLRDNVTDAQNEQGLDRKGEVSFSLSNDTAYMDNAIAKNNSMHHVDTQLMEDAKAVRSRIAERMNAIKDRGLVGLPEDIEGNTYIANSSYDGTEENTTICPRSLAAEALVDAVSEYLGRPLSVDEQIYISQDLQGRSLTPECTYCYVATDRKAYRAFLGEYIKQRDSVLDKLRNNPAADVSRSGEMYKEFLNGRKDTNPMYSRFKMWVNAYKNGTPMIDASHLANINKLMGDINSEFGEELKPQIVDAMKYAQSASWAKKRVNYVAYNGHILKWKQDRINKLNSHYGLRMYSFSDFHPAFVLENMQMITDASVRGLKMLGYTKDTDFVEIFAPSGMNINVSTFGFESDGNVYENNIIGAEWEKAKALREQYPNVGVTFVATNDTLVEWALEQDWIDVVIPYHLVRTGAEVAKAFNYTNYTSESSDTKTNDWKKGDSKYIAPTEHNNDLDTYLAALEKNHLNPRFKRFLDNPKTRPYYMKLVNECRQSASESKPVQPVFNEDAAMVALAKLEANGYYQPIGGSVDRMYEIAADVAENMTQQLAPAMSLSNIGEQQTQYGNYNISGKDVALDKAIAPVTENVTPVQESDQETVSPVTEETELSPDTPVAQSAVPKLEQLNQQKEALEGQQTMFEGAEKANETIRQNKAQRQAQILTEEPKVNKKKTSAWNLFKDNFVDKGTVFETMSLKTGNRELQAKWKAIGRAESSAQWFMENGNSSTSSLKSIRDTVEKSGKTKQFYEYLYHRHNVDRMNLKNRYPDMENKPVFGYDVTSEMSKKEAAKLETENPEFKDWANDVYSYMNNLREKLVDGGVISAETAKLWSEMYPNYVPIRRVGDEGLNINVALDSNRTGVNAPIKKATGGNRDILPLFDTMAMRTEQTFKAIAKNRFGVELKNMLGTTVENQAVGIDESIDSVETELLQEGKDGRNPTFTVFENGEKVTFEITDEMYDTMKPKSKAMGYTNKFLNTANNIRRGLLTEYNPAFMLTNPIKDTQDVLMNSQHPARTYANYPKAIAELIGKGQYYQEYMENGGQQNTYFDGESKTFAKEKSGLSKVIGFPLEKISQANNFIERVPRMAEYIASRKEGRSIDSSMLDAARVTTDFSAGGDFVKFANRNGFTFLNASVQGAVQQVRNVREAKAAGLKGWAKLAAKASVAGFSALLLNHLMWDDDEEYEELSDYVKQNYYIVGKYGDGKFVRIPKGRALAVIQNAFEQMENLVTGNDEVDLGTFCELVISNLAPNNPLENNLIAPITQAVNNKTWYGEDLVPTRLQDLPTEEQYDETTDAISKWLGEHTPISPYKWNYLLDQYSGAIGDVFLPMITPEAERGNDTAAGNLIAPLTDKFTTDGVMKNQNISDFYDKKDELTTNAKASGATEEDVLMNQYMNSINSELSELYAQKREIQNSDLSNAEKYNAVRDIQKQIVDLTRESLSTYDDIDYQSARDGEYVNIGNRYFKKDEEGEWQKLSDNQVTKYKVTSAAGDSSYASDGTNHYRWYTSEDGDTEGWRKITDEELERQSEVTEGLGISPEDYWNNKEEYSYAYDHPENYAVAKSVGGYDAYKGYSKDLSDIKSDKDKNGNTISGSRKEKVIEYINNLDADYGEKIILLKSEYPSDDTYNYEIIDYLNSRDDISYSEMEAILEELGFKVSSDGTITWD